MKRRLGDLDLTNQRSAQLRCISLPYIRAFWREKQSLYCRNFGTRRRSVWPAELTLGPKYRLGSKIRKRDMKRRLADLDLTNQRSAQLRSISVLYIRSFWRGKEQCRNRIVWVCATIVRQTVSAQSLLSQMNRNRTPNNNII